MEIPLGRPSARPRISSSAEYQWRRKLNAAAFLGSNGDISLRVGRLWTSASIDGESADEGWRCCERSGIKNYTSAANSLTVGDTINNSGTFNYSPGGARAR